MTEQKRVSMTGEIVVPRDVVAGQVWTAHTQREHVALPEGVLIRPKFNSRGTISWEEFGPHRIPTSEPLPTETEMAALLKRDAALCFLNKEWGRC
jgi:hypothetical protein